MTSPRPDGTERSRADVEAELALRSVTFADATSYLLVLLHQAGLTSDECSPVIAQAMASVAEEIAAITKLADLWRTLAADRPAQIALLSAYHSAPTDEARAAYMRFEAALLLHPGPPERADEWRQAMRKRAWTYAAAGDAVGIGRVTLAIETETKPGARGAAS